MGTGSLPTCAVGRTVLLWNTSELVVLMLRRVTGAGCCQSGERIRQASREIFGEPPVSAFADSPAVEDFPDNDGATVSQCHAVALTEDVLRKRLPIANWCRGVVGYHNGMPWL